MESPRYSLDKFRKAPEETLTPEEQAFLDQFNADMEKAHNHLLNDYAVVAIAAGLFRPENWRLLANRGKAELLDARKKESKAGQLELAQEEAEALNRKYDELAYDVETALRRFEAFKKSAINREPST